MAIMLGCDLLDELVKTLGLPKNTAGFNLRVRVDEIITATVRYYPEPLTPDTEGNLISLFKRYELREIPECGEIMDDRNLQRGHVNVNTKPADRPSYLKNPFLAAGGMWDFGRIRVWGWGIRWRRGRSVWKLIRSKPISKGLDFGRWSISWLFPEWWAK